MAQTEEERGRQAMTGTKRPRGTGMLYRQYRRPEHITKEQWKLMPEEEKDKFLVSKNWYVQYYRNGKVFRECTHTDSKTKAQNTLKRLVGMKDTEFISPTERRVTVDDLVDDVLVWYRTVKKMPTYADESETKWNLHLKPFFGNMRCSQVTTESLRRYRKERMSEGNPPSSTTVNRELQVIRKAFKLAVESKPPKVQTVPRFEMASEDDNKRMTFIPEEDKQKLRDAASLDTAKNGSKMKGLYLKCFVELLFSFGWRKGELTSLTVADVNIAEGFIRLEDSKNGEPREVPLTPNLKVLLEAVITGRKSDESLFPVKDMRHAWKRLCKNAGVKCGKDGYVIHDTRRTAARTKRAAGVSETVTSEIMGWKPGSKMFARYGIVDRADMVEALKRSEQFEQAQREIRENRHRTDIVSTETGANGVSRSNERVN
jgi:integrase